MKKLMAVLVVLVAVAIFAPAADAGDIVQMPEHGSLWRLAQECGRPGAAWTEIAAKNPWLKVKMAKGRPVALIHPGQPILLPDGWIAAEDGNGEESDTKTALFEGIWADFCGMAKDYPLPTIVLLFFIAAVISARNVADARRERQEQETESAALNQRGQWESIILPR
jgi:hypothetical protein